MGYGSYSAKDWVKLKQSRNLSQKKDVREVFGKTECDPKYNPLFIGTRECFDSEDHPNSTPIVVGLDVTASMGYLAVQVAQESLNDLIMKLYSNGVIEDPALMCAAYGDYKDKTPLQVTQFESDIRIAEQLLDLFFENGGYGEVVPTCLWEFLSKHTNIDAINKRNEKGFVFTIGDNAIIREGNIAETIKRVVGDEIPIATRESILKEVEKKFNVFHIMIGPVDGNPNFLNGHKVIIGQGEIKAIPDIIISIIRAQKGEPVDIILKDCDDIVRPTVEKALCHLSIFDNGQAISL